MLSYATYVVSPCVPRAFRVFPRAFRVDPPKQHGG